MLKIIKRLLKIMDRKEEAFPEGKIPRLWHYPIERSESDGIIYPDELDLFDSAQKK